jgi:hypothetical protein
MQARRMETDSISVSFELEMPATVNLDSLASHLEVATRGSFEMPLTEFATLEDSIAAAHSAIQKRLHPTQSHLTRGKSIKRLDKISS